MGWLSALLRVLAPIAVEHGGQVLRDSMRARSAQGKEQPPNGPDPVQQLAADVDQLKGDAVQLKSELDVLNTVIAEREERLRKWLLALLIWNITISIGLVVLAVLVLRR